MEQWERELSEIRAIMADNAKKMAETFEGFAKLEKLHEENAKGFAELRERQKRTDEQMKKTDKKLDRLDEIVNGVNNNIGYHAEQYFQNVFKK
ncbi:MAG: hypothetical protein LBH98_09990, partial [Chitinispirillales bacterium]|nr:hypothetical protein [Chitinispirillales bacterium]